MTPSSLKKTDFSPEMKLLLGCCTKIESKNKNTKIDRLIRDDTNWDTFLSLVDFHQVTPLVYYNLKKISSNRVPQKILNCLKSDFNKFRFQNLALMAQLLCFVNTCQAEDIPVICLKGPVLSYQLYGDISLRQIMDIDFFIREGDIKKIHHLLIDSGYETQLPEIFSSNIHWKVFTKSKHHIPYIHLNTLFHLELHFRLFKNLHTWPNKILNAWDNPGKVSYAGAWLNTLQHIDNIIFLFVHGSIHRWYRIKWLADIAQLSLSWKVDWEKLRERSLEIELDRPVQQGLLLLEHIFGIPQPEAFSHVPISKGVFYMTELALNTTGESKESTRYGLRFALKNRFYLLRLKKDRRYRLRYLRDFFYLDSHRRILRLPGFLYPLYVLLNPFLWLYKNYIKGKIFRKK